MFVFPVGPLFRLRVSHHLDYAPFPHPAHQTGRADFPHPAFGQGLLNNDSHTFAHEPLPRCSFQLVQSQLLVQVMVRKSFLSLEIRCQFIILARKIRCRNPVSVHHSCPENPVSVHHGKSGVSSSFLPVEIRCHGNPVSGNPVSVHHSCPKRCTDTGLHVRGRLEKQMKMVGHQAVAEEAKGYRALVRARSPRNISRSPSGPRTSAWLFPRLIAW